jgi:hypothetical protein
VLFYSHTIRIAIGFSMVAPNRHKQDQGDFRLEAEAWQQAADRQAAAYFAELNSFQG